MVILKNEEKTQEVIVEIDGKRWYRAGNKGYVDSDGFLIIVDRYSRFAKIDWEMISLTAVEEKLREILDDLELELELAVISLSDEKKEEKIVVLTAGDLKRDEIKNSFIGG